MGDFGELDYSNDNVTYTYKGKRYILTSHPYEPCLYMWEKDLRACTLHNAYNPDDLKNAFSAVLKLAFRFVERSAMIDVGRIGILLFMEEQECKRTAEEAAERIG